MTPVELETAARRKYNAVGDTFYSQAEILDLAYQGCLEMVNECLYLIPKVLSTTTVSGAQQYSFPTNVVAAKRVTYDGVKLQKIDDRDDDTLTLGNSTTTATGSSRYYWQFNDTFYLRPIPDSALVLKVFGYAEPQALTSSSVLEIPSQFHMDLVNFIVSEMCAKDENFTMASYYMGRWEKGVARAKRFAQKAKRTDSFSAVKDEEGLANTILGAV